MTAAWISVPGLTGLRGVGLRSSSPGALPPTSTILPSNSEGLICGSRPSSIIAQELMTVARGKARYAPVGP